MTNTLTNDRKLEVAQQIVAVQRMYAASFRYDAIDPASKEYEEHYPPRAIEQAMKQCERAFADEHYDQAEHLAKVTARMIERTAPKFAANPKLWIGLWCDRNYERLRAEEEQDCADD